MKFLKSRDERWVAIMAFAVASAVAVLNLRAIISHFMVDDSFYYLEIARNISMGKGTTFDGLHATNGFHPLFQFLIVPVFWITRDSEAAIRILKVLEALIFSAGAVLLYRLMLRLAPGRAAAWVAVGLLYLPGPWAHPLAKGVFIGMESGLNFMMILLLVSVWVESFSEQKARGFFFVYGLVIALAFLARLDNIILIAALAAGHVYFLRKRSSPEVPGLLVAAALSLAVAGPYLLWNYANFHSIVPISGRINFMLSQQISRDLLSQGWLPWLENTAWFIFRFKAVAVLPWCGLILVPLVFLLRRLLVQTPHGKGQMDPVSAALLCILWVSSVIRISYYAAFQQYPRSDLFWYYVQEVVLIAVCGGLLGGWLFERFKIRRPAALGRAAALALMVFSLGAILTTKPILEWEVASLDATTVVKQLVAADDILGAKDAGVLGYFLPNPVVNLDGMVNDGRFYEYLEDGRAAEYVREEDIRYLVNLAAPTPDDLLTELVGHEHLELIYTSDTPVPVPAGWIYKVYRVLP